jgi:hypothetical protein
MPKRSLVLRSAVVAALLAALLSFAPPASAGVLDLTTAGASGMINGAIYTQGTTNSGTGVFPAFVQVQKNGSEQGYNTTVGNTLDNKNDATHNHEIRVGDIPVFVVNGQSYYRFFLDINEVNNGVDNYLSLDAVQIYTSSIPNQSTTNVPSLGTLRYDQGANSVALDYNLQAGSGKADMTLLVPVWANPNPNDYVYLYSMFGSMGIVALGGLPPGDYGTSDGFEEWALGQGGGIGAVPEPSSILLGLTAVAGFGGFAGWRRRRAAKA